MPKLNIRTYIFFLVIIVCVLSPLTFYLITKSGHKPSIDDIWVINLDKDTERLKFILSQEKHLPQKIQRFPAVYGKDLDRDLIANLDGVQTIISRSNNAEENKRSNKVLNKVGEIGCWVSHKRLLKKLNSQNYPSDFGHLICEDDIIIPKDFSKQWAKASLAIPSNWDMVFLGAGDVYGTRINKYVVKWKHDRDVANWGTYAYLVRHKSLGKILDKLVLMSAPIDVQYYKMLGNLNIYALDPVLITVNFSDFKSSIDGQEIR